MPTQRLLPFTTGMTATWSEERSLQTSDFPGTVAPDPGGGTITRFSSNIAA